MQPRFIPPNTLVEITTRTSGSRLYLRPSKEFNERVLGIMGRALLLFPVLLHSFVFLSNHWHTVVTAPNAEMLANWLRYVNGNVAKAAQELNGVKGKVWGRRAQIIPILDDDSQRLRLRYVLSHGTKEHLVASPLQWPGVTSARALVGDETLKGVWVDRVKKRRLERRTRGGAVDPSEYTKEYPITLTPLPIHLNVPRVVQQGVVRELLAEIEAEHPGPHLGVAKVLAQDPQAMPVETRMSSAPVCHTTCPTLRARYESLRSEFYVAYRESAARHKRNPTRVTWPIDAFLPAWAFVPSLGARPLLRMLEDPSVGSTHRGRRSRP